MTILYTNSFVLAIIPSKIILYNMVNLKSILKKSYYGLKYFVYLCKEIISSSITVARLIWLEPNKIKPEYFAVSGKLPNRGFKVFYAHSITLTPGTISVAIKDQKIEICSMNKSFKMQDDNDMIKGIKELMD